jgi:hypothetical protein
MLNKTRPFLLLFFCSFCLALLNFGCANRQLPQGGPRDRTPPKLLKATPSNMTRYFKGQVIQLDFDEYFKLNNGYTEISMSPATAKLPEYKVKNKSLIITIKDTLEKNTTYVINFGKAIADVNEGNILKNFTYVFSTGPHIDSLSMSGNVISSVTQQREKDVTVMLFTLKQDSLLFGKKRPTIYTTTDTAGNFSLNNLHEGDYRIYALKETSPNKIYDNDKELIAFNKKNIHLTTDTSNIQLRLFHQDPDKFRLIDRRFDQDGKMFFSFNKKLTAPSLKIVYPPDFDSQKIVDINKTKDTAILYMRNMNFDSIRVAFLDKGVPLDTIYLKKKKKETFQRALSLNPNLINDKLKPGTDLVLKGNFPIDSYDASLIVLKEDSTEVSNFTLQKDTANPRQVKLLYRWKQNAKYTLTLNEGAFIDMYGDKSKYSLRRFQQDKVENYSQLTLAFTVPDSGKSYVIELLGGAHDLLQTDIIHKNTSLVYKNYVTGKYTVRVIYDANGNGVWDSGNVKKKIQPENIWADPDIITLRPNWEQVTPIAIPREPPTP